MPCSFLIPLSSSLLSTLFPPLTNKGRWEGLVLSCGCCRVALRPGHRACQERQLGARQVG